MRLVAAAPPSAATGAPLSSLAVPGRARRSAVAHAAAAAARRTAVGPETVSGNDPSGARIADPRVGARAQRIARVRSGARRGDGGVEMRRDAIGDSRLDIASHGGFVRGEHRADPTRVRREARASRFALPPRAGQRAPPGIRLGAPRRRRRRPSERRAPPSDCSDCFLVRRETRRCRGRRRRARARRRRRRRSLPRATPRRTETARARPRDETRAETTSPTRASRRTASAGPPRRSLAPGDPGLVRLSHRAPPVASASPSVSARATRARSPFPRARATPRRRGSRRRSQKPTHPDRTRRRGGAWRRARAQRRERTPHRRRKPHRLVVFVLLGIPRAETRAELLKLALHARQPRLEIALGRGSGRGARRLRHFPRLRPVHPLPLQVRDARREIGRGGVRATRRASRVRQLGLRGPQVRFQSGRRGAAGVGFVARLLLGGARAASAEAAAAASARASSAAASAAMRRRRSSLASARDPAEARRASASYRAASARAAESSERSAATLTALAATPSPSAGPSLSCARAAEGFPAASNAGARALTLACAHIKERGARTSCGGFRSERGATGRSADGAGWRGMARAKKKA